MAGSKDAKDAVEKEALSGRTAYICVDNVSERKLKKWDLKNFLKEAMIKC